VSISTIHGATATMRPHQPYLRPPSDLCIAIGSQIASCDIQTPNPGPLTPSDLSRDRKPVLNSDSPQPSPITSSLDGFSIDSSRISVIIVASGLLFRLGLARLLSEDDRLDVIGVSDGEPDLLGHCRATSVNVVLLDIQLSRTDGIDLVRLLASECPNTRTLVLTSNADWRVRPAMIAGAAGVLLKDTSPEAIRAAVVSVHLGDQVLCNEAARWVLGEEPSTHLTQREADVLRMVAQGANNAEIAAQLQLGQKTVRNYVSRLYRKLALTNRAQIATYLVNTDIERNASRAGFALVENESYVQGQ